MSQELGRNYIPRTTLLLLGGGPKPQEAMAEFFKSAMATSGRGQVMVITWASEEPEGTCKMFSEESIPFLTDGLNLDFEVEAPQTAAEVEAFRGRLFDSTAVFFSGGDQRRIMNVLNQWPSIAHALRAQFECGIAFGGTSAGTAIMTPEIIFLDRDPTAFCPKQVEVGSGLGLLPGCLVDQHFIKRQRQNRLFARIMHSPEVLGIGVDEGAALFVYDGRWGKVVGPEKVMIVDGASMPGSLKVDVLDPSECYDLKLRKDAVTSDFHQDSTVSASVA